MVVILKVHQKVSDNESLFREVISFYLENTSLGIKKKASTETVETCIMEKIVLNSINWFIYLSPICPTTFLFLRRETS